MPQQKVPLPNPIPGRFFVLAFDRSTRNYSLVVDDATHSSYKLGSDVQTIRRYFKRVGLDVYFSDRAIDVATEFRVVQAIPEGSRVIVVRNPPRRGESDPFSNREENGAEVFSDLPVRF
jgi:hypothetical protein